MARCLLFQKPGQTAKFHPWRTDLPGNQASVLAPPLPCNSDFHDPLSHQRTRSGSTCRILPTLGQWVEAEKKLKETPLLLRTPAGYVQPSPWLAISNKNVELMHKFMSELGLSPVSRSRVATTHHIGPKPWEFTGEDEDEFFT
ncbi:MAG: P27 family phage terminase small subunit [Mesorhizobium sp.]|nr:MAG: P27 family phage terminase small subunit [Mesorhizobium sp.]TJU90624.1 MAG: P27 family phage terminase small subunit [Mesorhizobium sp.]